MPLPNLQRPLNEGVEANQRRGILRELERQQERRRTMPRCCAGDACRHPDVPFLAVTHYCLTCPEGDHRNRGHGPCLVAVRLDGGKLLRLDNSNESGFVKEEHLTDLGREKWDNEMNGVCLACWDRLAEDETQPARDGDPGEPPRDLVLELLDIYSTRSEAVAEDSIMRHLRQFYRSRAYFENKIRRTCVIGARGGGGRGGGGGSGLLNSIRTADQREGVRQDAIPTKDFTTVRYKQLRWRRQKNLVNGEITPYKVEDDAIPALCPVRAALRIYQLIVASTDKR